ncbi:toll/interleukin-1 receptor domain-containing protein, partial [candidate division KSB1 bacterium]|nr:toll/interleukin-1 receptor domain-containing protein [candidate division KSB1 bacterium]
LTMDERSGRPGKMNFWWDNKKIDGSVLFNQSIEEGINKSAIMICLNSQGYMESDYCKQELDLFYKKAQNEKSGLKVANRSRILNVLLYNIPSKEWLNELSGAIGYPFHGDPPLALSQCRFKIMNSSYSLPLYQAVKASII